MTLLTCDEINTRHNIEQKKTNKFMIICLLFAHLIEHILNNIIMFKYDIVVFYYTTRP